MYPQSIAGAGERRGGRRTPRGTGSLDFVPFLGEALLKLGEGRFLDLADALAGEPQLPADLVERHRVPFVQSEAEAQDRGLAVADRAQEEGDPLEVRGRRIGPL